MATAHALKRNMTALGLESRVIAAIVINPQPEKQAGDEQTVSQSGDYDIHLLGKECRRH
jgi:hypothetical protein